MIQDFAHVLRDQIRRDMNNYADDLAGGACRSFEEYQKLCGIISGLALAERYVLDLLKKVEDADNH
jgi:hypothetical protein|tara:strand:+ start:356 stop:553 length:198 start_codon:yes stop_codon:yes gene_type:complete